MITTMTPSYIDFTINGQEFRVTGETSDRQVYLVFRSSVQAKKGEDYVAIPKREEREAILQALKKLADAEKISLGFQ